MDAVTAATTDEPDARLGRGLWMVVLATLLVYLVNTNASPLGDSAAAFPIATSIVAEQNLTLDEYAREPGFASGGWVERNSGGALVAYFPWATGLAAVPIVVAVDVASLVGIGDGADAVVKPMGRGHALLQSIAGSLWTTLAVAAVYVFARRSTPGRSPWLAGSIALVFAFGTSAWSTAAFQLWQHGPSLACTAWAIVILQRLAAISEAQWARRRVLALGCVLGVLVGFAAILRPTNFIVVAAASVVVALQYRRILIPFLAGGALVAAPWFAATRVAYGAWLQPYGGSDRLQLHGEYLEALAANLVSSGRGVFVFSPILAVAVVGGVRVARSFDTSTALERMSLVIIPVHWLAISALPHWTGGFSFGPRLFTDVLPFMAVLAVPVVAGLPVFAVGGARHLRLGAAASTMLVVVVAVVSVGIHAQSTLVISTRCWNRVPVNVDDDYGRVWSMSDPMVTAGYRDLFRSPSDSVRGVCTRR